MRNPRPRPSTASLRGECGGPYLAPYDRQVPRAPRTDLRRALARSRARWLWQPDKWRRLLAVSDLVEAGHGETVADVGGRGHELAGLLAGSQVTSVNVEQPCDLLVTSGSPLPFADGGVDRVTSTDVLEHMPEEARTAHLAELVRIARTRVVLCFPAGSPAKDASERRTAEGVTRINGSCPDFLAEHLQFGLPRAGEVAASVRGLVPDARVAVVYQDGVVESERMLLDAYAAVRRLRPGAFARSVRAWLVRRRPVLTTRASDDNTRAFVVIDLVP